MRFQPLRFDLNPIPQSVAQKMLRGYGIEPEDKGPVVGYGEGYEERVAREEEERRRRAKELAALEAEYGTTYTNEIEQLMGKGLYRPSGEISAMARNAPEDLLAELALQAGAKKEEPFRGADRVYEGVGQAGERYFTNLPGQAQREGVTELRRYTGGGGGTFNVLGGPTGVVKVRREKAAELAGMVKRMPKGENIVARDAARAIPEYHDTAMEYGASYALDRVREEVAAGRLSGQVGAVLNRYLEQRAINPETDVRDGMPLPLSAYQPGGQLEGYVPKDLYTVRTAREEDDRVAAEQQKVQAAEEKRQMRYHAPGALLKAIVDAGSESDPLANILSYSGTLPQRLAAAQPPAAATRAVGDVLDFLRTSGPTMEQAQAYSESRIKSLTDFLPASARVPAAPSQAVQRQAQELLERSPKGVTVKMGEYTFALRNGRLVFDRESWLSRR